MRTIIRLTIMGLLTLILSGGNVSGQGQSSVPVRGNGRGAANIFSDQQKEMLKQRTVLSQNFRKEFRASISQKQKDILGRSKSNAGRKAESIQGFPHRSAGDYDKISQGRNEKDEGGIQGYPYS